MGTRAALSGAYFFISTAPTSTPHVKTHSSSSLRDPALIVRYVSQHYLHAVTLISPNQIKYLNSSGERPRLDGCWTLDWVRLPPPLLTRILLRPTNQCYSVCRFTRATHNLQFASLHPGPFDLNKTVPDSLHRNEHLSFAQLPPNSPTSILLDRFILLHPYQLPEYWISRRN